MDMSGLGGGFRRIYGVVSGIVVEHHHDNGEYRIKVKFPWLRDKTDAGDDEDFLSSWARICTTMAGKNMGWWCLPEVEDEVACMFEFGDPRRPIIIGSLWNGKDTPPVEGIGTGPEDSTDPMGQKLNIKDACKDTTDKGGKNRARFFLSRAGHLLLFDDATDQKDEKIVLKTKRGHTLVLNDVDGKESIALYDSTGEEYLHIDEKNKKITLETKDGDIDVFCKNGTFNLEAKDIKMKASNTIEVKSDKSTKHESGTTFDIKAGADCTIKGGPNIKLN